MKNIFHAGILLVLFFPSGLYAQDTSGPETIRLGGMDILPVANVLEAYDNRVRLDDAGNASSDFYTEVGAGVTVKNLPARYNLFASAAYGYRFYSDFDELNDDFYNVGASVGSDQKALQWSLSADWAKTLNYDTIYDPATGTGPDSILTDQPSRRVDSRGNISYAMALSDKTALVPGYSIQYYQQEFDGGGSAEWQSHSASVMMRHAYTPKTTFLIGGYYDLQVNGDEDGYIAAVGVGIEREISEKTSWKALVGYGHADYDLSGSSEGGLADLSAQWQATDKISTYVFYGNTYEPGYGGGPARMLYRAGYGAGWQFATKWNLGGQVLHSYEDALGSDNNDTVYGGVRHFFSAQCGYAMTTKLNLALTGSFVNDERPVDHTVVSIRLDYAY